MHDDLNGVGNDFARDQGEVHSLVPHGDAIGNGDGTKLKGVAATGVHTLFGRLSKAIQAQVAGGDFVPAGSDTNLGLVPVSISHSYGSKHAA